MASTPAFTHIPCRYMQVKCQPSYFAARDVLCTQPSLSLARLPPTCSSLVRVFIVHVGLRYAGRNNDPAGEDLILFYLSQPMY